MPIAILAHREPVGGTLERLVFEVDAATAHTHLRHGQYVEVRPLEGDGKGFFVLASAPGAQHFSLVVKPAPGVATQLVDAPIGARFAVSEARGRGYPLEEQRGKPLLLAATGSGLAAMLSSMHARVADGDAARTYLVYGVRERRDVSLASELAAVRDAGMEVAICLSREHAEEPGFFRGYVQEIARRHGWELGGGKVFAAGSQAMLEGMREVTEALGLAPADVLVNF
jgi:NAD(P)H-flavin reductase